MENKSEKIAVNKEELRKRLTPLQYQVTQEAGTERPFTGWLKETCILVSTNVILIYIQDVTISNATSCKYQFWYPSIQ